MVREDLLRSVAARSASAGDTASDSKEVWALKHAINSRTPSFAGRDKVNLQLAEFKTRFKRNSQNAGYSKVANLQPHAEDIRLAQDSYSIAQCRNALQQLSSLSTSPDLNAQASLDVIDVTADAAVCMQPASIHRRILGKRETHDSGYQSCPTSSVSGLRRPSPERRLQRNAIFEHMPLVETPGSSHDGTDSPGVIRAVGITGLRAAHGVPEAWGEEQTGHKSAPRAGSSHQVDDTTMKPPSDRTYVYDWICAMQGQIDVPRDPDGMTSVSNTETAPSVTSDDEIDKMPQCSSKPLLRRLMRYLQNDTGCSSIDKHLSEQSTNGYKTCAGGRPGSRDVNGPAADLSIGADAVALSAARRSSERDKDGEPPAKRPNGNQEQGGSVPLQAENAKIQIPCPLRMREGCLGTNESISDMLRSLKNRHRTLICQDCCTDLLLPEDEKKPDEFLRRHVSSNCKPICISRTCTAGPSSDSVPHRRTVHCPSLKAIPKEVRWSSIWRILNPGRELPDVEFCAGLGFEHSDELRPTKERSRNKGVELYQDFAADMQRKDDRIRSLEHELVITRSLLEQLQQSHDNELNTLRQQFCEERKNLKGIIDGLFERMLEPRQASSQSTSNKTLQEYPDYSHDLLAPPVQLSARRPMTPKTTPSTTSRAEYLSTSNPVLSSSSGNGTLGIDPGVMENVSRVVGPEDDFYSHSGFGEEENAFAGAF